MLSKATTPDRRFVAPHFPGAPEHLGNPRPDEYTVAHDIA